MEMYHTFSDDDAKKALAAIEPLKQHWNSTLFPKTSKHSHHHANSACGCNSKTSLTSAKIMLALKQFYDSEKLDGFTIGCFDLLNPEICHGTSCLALGFF